MKKISTQMKGEMEKVTVYISYTMMTEMEGDIEITKTEYNQLKKLENHPSKSKLAEKIHTKFARQLNAHYVGEHEGYIELAD